MGDLRPLGSEKLTGVDKLKRIMEIATYKEHPKNNINENTGIDYSVELADGLTYGIVREKQGYIIKKGLNESELDYSEPMKQRKYFRSYSEAMKKLNLTASEVNRLYENKEGISLIGEQANQKKKFILKLPKVGSGAETKTPEPPVEDVTTTPATPPTTDIGTPPVPTPNDTPVGAPTTSPESDMAPAPMPGDTETTPPVDDTPIGNEPPSDDMGMDNEPPSDDMGMDDDQPEEPTGDQQGPTGLKTIQKLTGRLSQKIRAFDKDKGLDSQDIKYVLNSIISALDLENLDEDDKDDILSKFDESDEYGEEGPGELDFSDESEMEEPEEEPVGMGGDMSQPPVSESKVEDILKKYFVINENETPSLEEKKQKDFLKRKLQKINIKNEVERLSESEKQKRVAVGLLNENAKFVGKTNLENLIFIKNGKQIKVTPRGGIL